MRFQFHRLLLATAVLSLTAATAHAQEAEDYVALRAGLFDIGNAKEAFHFGLEYRGVPFYYSLLPIIGIEANTDRGVYGYAGLAYDWQFTPSWSLMPSFAVGAYKDGKSKDLGGVLEFRSGIELGYTMENQHRLGLALHHLSNASIYDSNPGTETVMFSYSIPY